VRAPTSTPRLRRQPIRNVPLAETLSSTSSPLARTFFFWRPPAAAAFAMASFDFTAGGMVVSSGHRKTLSLFNAEPLEDGGEQEGGCGPLPSTLALSWTAARRCDTTAPGVAQSGTRGGLRSGPATQVKTHESINNRLALVMKSGKYTLGYKTTLKSLRGGKCAPLPQMRAHERTPAGLRACVRRWAGGKRLSVGDVFAFGDERADGPNPPGFFAAERGAARCSLLRRSRRRDGDVTQFWGPCFDSLTAG
jgi:hypothetical protein